MATGMTLTRSTTVGVALQSLKFFDVIDDKGLSLEEATADLESQAGVLLMRIERMFLVVRTRRVLATPSH